MRSFDEIVTGLEDDKFFQTLSLDGKQELLQILFNESLEGRFTHCAGSVEGKWHGEIKYCPKCCATRVTTCCACGCGSCMTCDYRWLCNPYNVVELDGKTVVVPLPQFINVSKPEFYDYTKIYPAFNNITTGIEPGVTIEPFRVGP